MKKSTTKKAGRIKEFVITYNNSMIDVRSAFILGIESLILSDDTGHNIFFIIKRF